MSLYFGGGDRGAPSLARPLWTCCALLQAQLRYAAWYTIWYTTAASRERTQTRTDNKTWIKNLDRTTIFNTLRKQ